MDLPKHFASYLQVIAICIMMTNTGLLIHNAKGRNKDNTVSTECNVENFVGNDVVLTSGCDPRKPTNSFSGKDLYFMEIRNTYSTRGQVYNTFFYEELVNETDIHLRNGGYIVPPVAKSKWPGVFDATEDGPYCPQDGWYEVGGQEDCLMLNVYAPKFSQDGTRSTNKSVMIFVHGGGLHGGSGLYGDYPPERLMDSDIILVTINYRLGILGFLSTGDASSPGNYGLLDQVLAFQWVKDNIEVFGGNPDSVTIFGESSGGASVSYHLISPVSKGLFHRAIEMSGTDLCSNHFESNPLFWAKFLASQVDCPLNDTVLMLECFRGKSYQELILAMAPTLASNYFNIPFAPTVDGQFLTSPPRDILSRSPEKINNVPVLSGCTEMETALIPQGMEFLKPDISILSEDSFNFVFNYSLANPSVNVSRMIRDHYLKSANVTNKFEENKLFVKATADGIILMYHFEEAQYLSKAGLDIYLYSYDYGTTNTDDAGAEDRKYGIKHTEDLITLFNTTADTIPFEENDYKMVNIMTEVWSNFAKTGHPDPNNKYLPQWKRSTAELLHIHHLNLSITVEDYDVNNDETFKFWTRDVVETLANQQC